MRRLALFIFVLLIHSPAQSFEFTVLHTNDLHSYFEGTGPDRSFTAVTGDGDPIQGHYARLAHLIKKEKREDPEGTLLVDAGDFFAGTLFQALAPQGNIPLFPEAEFFKMLDYDATTLGNHEFDAYDRGLLIMLKKWKSLGVETPLVSTNAFVQIAGSPLEPFFREDGLIRPYLVKEIKDGNKSLKLGILGLMGPDGALVSLGVRRAVGFKGFEDHSSSASMKTLAQSLRPTLQRLQQKEKVDLVIALMHGGAPEDRQLLELLPEIDLLVSGHTHQVYPRPLRVGKSLLVQAGSFGRFLGKLRLRWDGSELSVLNQDSILEVNDLVPVDPEMMTIIDNYKLEIDKILFSTGLQYSSYIFNPQKAYKRSGPSLKDLGRKITSGIRKEINRSLPNPVDVYFSALGLIRKGIPKNQPHQLSDIFKILGIGFDENLEPGGKAVRFYLSKKDFFYLLHFMEWYSGVSSKFTPAFSKSVSYKRRWWGLPFVNKLGNLQLHGKPYDQWPPYVHVACSQYVADYLPRIGSMSFGLLDFVARDQDGLPIDTPYIFPEKEYILLSKSLKQTAVEAK